MAPVSLIEAVLKVSCAGIHRPGAAAKVTAAKSIEAMALHEREQCQVKSAAVEKNTSCWPAP